MKKITASVLLFCIIISGFGQDLGPTSTVRGEVLRPLSISVKQLVAMKTTEVNGKDRDGKERTFKGVMLWVLLDSAGVTLGKDLRGENLAKYVLVKASDGYKVVFSLPEVDPEFSDKTILLAYEADGKPLAAHEGPFRLVVPQDKKHARWIRQLKSIEIILSGN
jgi:DMSO/TMAO reductase YedYZ molybdopterin-dependent catalytic subunit